MENIIVYCTTVIGYALIWYVKLVLLGFCIISTAGNPKDITDSAYFGSMYQIIIGFIHAACVPALMIKHGKEKTAYTPVYDRLFLVGFHFFWVVIICKVFG